VELFLLLAKLFIIVFTFPAADGILLEISATLFCIHVGTISGDILIVQCMYINRCKPAIEQNATAAELIFADRSVSAASG
jgi:hypothetical protein